MSDLIPSEVFSSYKDGKLDKETAIEYFKSFAEISENEHLRVRAVNLLGEIAMKSMDIFKFLEHLLISDSNDYIRSLVAGIIIRNYIDIGQEAIRWTFLNEKKINCLIMLYKALEECDTEESQLLKLEMERELGKRYIEKYGILPREAIGLKFAELSTGYEIMNENEYSKDQKVHAVFKSKNQHVVDLIISGFNLNNTFFLNLLSNLESLTLSTTNLRRIECFSNLTKLKSLDLTANFLTEIPDLHCLRNLESLKIEWNNISYLIGIEKLEKIINAELSHNLFDLESLSKIENQIISNHRTLNITNRFP